MERLQPTLRAILMGTRLRRLSSGMQRQIARLRLRMMVLRYGAYSIAFWTTAVILASWCIHFGYAWVAWAALGVWVVLSLPALYVQANVIVDLANYALSGRIYLV